MVEDLARELVIWISREITRSSRGLAVSMITGNQQFVRLRCIGLIRAN